MNDKPDLDDPATWIESARFWAGIAENHVDHGNLDDVNATASMAAVHAQIAIALQGSRIEQQTVSDVKELITSEIDHSANATRDDGAVWTEEDMECAANVHAKPTYPDADSIEDSALELADKLFDYMRTGAYYSHEWSGQDHLKELLILLVNECGIAKDIQKLIDDAHSTPRT